MQHFHNNLDMALRCK